ncbi:MAG: riboflavin synthase [Anaerococcus sp.]|uniref:riboflavin synthase n=1 Tax=Anaerococcus sp. TaxID=1872515 RepID=UPI002913E7E5|nr:riboflavin synthase [Anaerococcus sp.]MDU5228887.1 riboflavin synthase [Anaerococcus sp.]MDU7412078.1 riboflavin synthase [Anaerococcus sp.]
MFTGISEEIGEVVGFIQQSDHVTIEVKADKVLEDIKKGDSIMTDGVCLTVTSFTDKSYTADIMSESLKVTKFDRSILLKKVNLERAMRIGSRLDGHIVQGHVDGLGNIIAINKNVYRIKTTRDISKYIVKKGSVAIDGISLTVSMADKDIFEVSLIPETLEATNFKYKKINDQVNIETDIIGRYIEKLTEDKERVDKNFLLENGF